MNGKPCQLQTEVDTLRDKVENLSTLVSEDTLTGLFNYRYFMTAMEQELERCRRTGQAISLMMIDDHFKKVNDDWGHEVGTSKIEAYC